ncbi:MAG: hypothetical protein KA369_06495 [Spirochaetes bacterium]|nr:hypothetical protein [Spirochaetota bacterium]
MVLVLAFGFFAAVTNALDDGWWLFSSQLTHGSHEGILLVLGFCALVMFAIEMAIRYKKEGHVIAVSPKIRNRRFGAFIIECAVNYALDLAILAGALFFFNFANEYGVASRNPYYRPFFVLLNIAWDLYLLWGFPYIVLTRSLQHDPEADRREPAYLLLKALVRIFGRLHLLDLLKKPDLFDIRSDGNADTFGPGDKKILLALLVKMFFVPLMTVFFTDQFTHLVGNWRYIVAVLAGIKENIRFGIMDFYNVAFTVIFSIDVGLAWCGYTLSTRWLRNTCLSVEPTLLGWMAAVLCYPPFQHFLGIYFTIPSEKGFLTMPHPWAVALFALLSIMSYVVYMSATVVFGLRFSNLTHRGIIRTGAYAVIRHPAYAAKNFSWWCVMMPYVIYQAVSQNAPAVLVQVLGLAGMTGLYYLRAVTEERHLSIDPAYREYCKEVPYRFIPGIL